MNEVSGKALGLLHRAAEHYGLSLDVMFEGLPITPSSEPDRFDWDTLCTLHDRLGQLCEGHVRLDRIGELLFSVPRMQRVCTAVQLVASPRMLYWAGHMWAAPSTFRNIDCQYEELSDDVLRLTATISEPYRDSPELLKINQGTFRAMPRLLGLPDARVEIDLRPRVAVYTVHLPPSLTLWARLRRGVRLFAAPKAVLGELRDQNEQLRQRFDELTEANAETERMRLDAERARDLAEDALRVKSEFLATISHELRTPLNGVVGMCDLLRDTHLNREQREYAETIYSSAETLVGLINDVLDFSKIEAGKLLLERVEFDPRGVTDAVLQSLSALAWRKGIALTGAVDADVPDRVLGDPERFRKVLVNLVGNAVKFTERGTISVRASLVERHEASAVLRLTVRDTGIGISREALGQLFEPFCQADASTTRRYGGTGLGLAICRRLVTQMGGEIGVDTVEGSGSTFWFVLPFDLPAPSEEAAHRPATKAAEPHAPASTRPRSMRPKGPSSERPRPRCWTVLVVDDNPVNLKVTQRILQKLDYNVETAMSAKGALEAFESGSFDAVLMDCQMPDVDGYEATARIRALEAAGRRRTPVIALTANALPEDRDRCLDAGMDDYIAKPVKAEVIRETLARWIKSPFRSDGAGRGSVSPIALR